MAAPKFEVVQDDESPAPPQESSLAIDGIMLALKALSQRTIVALAALRTLLMVGSVFALAYGLHDPNAYQLALLGIYAGFVAAITVLTRKGG